MTTAATDLGEDHARRLDAADPLAGYRDRFLLPTGRRRHAQGLPRRTVPGRPAGSARAEVEAELDAWARLGVDGWFAAKRAGSTPMTPIREPTARLVGARPGEIATMNTLTVNLHLLLATFFRPAGARTAILIDAPTFPSDRYAVESQLRLHGLDPARDLIVVRPRDGRGDCSGPRISKPPSTSTGDRLAVALLAGVNYATGQAHDIERLTAAVHDAGAVACGTSPTRSATSRSRCTMPTSTAPRGAPTSTSTAARARSARSSSTSGTRRTPRAPAVRLVGQRPGHPVRDGRDLRPGARRRRLADLDAAHPVAGPASAPRSRSSTRSACRPCAGSPSS